MSVSKFSRLKQDKKFLELVKNVQEEMENGRLESQSDEVEQKTRFH